MAKSVRYALIGGTVFLIGLVLGVHKPGMPVTLKADEPAYFLMALSLARDGDLACEAEDYRRLLDSYPYLPTENLILMSDDGGETVLFGKPYIYSLLAAPLAWLFGANGIVAFNALLFAAMILMGTLYLRTFNSDGMAALFAAAFFLISPALPYVFWLQPEILNMAAVTACLFFAFHRFAPRPTTSRLARISAACFNETTAPLLSGAALAIGIYNKPMLALVALPALVAIARRRTLRAAVGWMVAAAVCLAVVVTGSVLLTGHPTAYLGVVRTGVNVEFLDKMDSVVKQAFELTVERSTTGNSWSWMFRLPSPAPGEITENLRYFLIGRHVGLVPYFPFSILCLVFFLLHDRRTPERWSTIAALAATALFFLLTIPLNWHGGGGFVGNRYFAMVYPGFLFLATTLRPAWLMLPVVAAGGVMLGPLLATPFTAPVLSPTLQAHVRGPLWRHLPHELSLRLTVPGYSYFTAPQALFIGRKDVFKLPKELPGVIWVHGATRADILLLTERPIEGVFFEVGSWAPANRVRLALAGDTHEVVFDASHRKRRTEVVELRPQRIDHHHVDHLSRKRVFAYDLAVEPATGDRYIDSKDASNVFFVGAELRYLGRRDQVGRPEHYRIDWLEVEAPDRAPAGSTFSATVSFRNAGESALSSAAGLPVFLSYHWFDESGQALLFGGRRTRIEAEVEPGGAGAATVTVEAPNEPGRYRLALDAVREPVAWFSQKGNETWEQLVEVTAAAVSPDSPAP